MAPTGPQDILNGTYIGATNAVDNVQVYAQDASYNIRQSVFENGIWSGGNPSDVIATAKPNSSIAVCSGNGMGRIRVFYINSKNILQEKSWDTNDDPNNPTNHWVDGPLNAKALQVAPNSDIAAFTVADTTEALQMCIYFQTTDNHIQEYYYLDEKDGWTFGQTFDPQLAGTRIAAFNEPSNVHHVYFQSTNSQVVEWVWNSGNSPPWSKGIFFTGGSPPAIPCALAAVRTVGFPGSQAFFHVYYQDQNNNIAEMTWDFSSWYFSYVVGTAIPNSHLAAVAWQGNTLAQNRIYFQDGKNGTAIAEYEREDDEWAFQSSVPPLT